jgi:uncharacterized membrane protein YkoI
MDVLNWKAATINVVAGLFGVLAVTSFPQAHGAQLVVPMGALAHAAATLEKATGGRILEVRLADAAGSPVFEAAVVKDDGLLYMRVASPSDEVTEIKVSDLPQWLLDYHLQGYTRSVAEERVPLAEAVLKAEKRDLAPAIDAGVAKPLGGANAVLAYFVDTLKGSRRRGLVVDAKTGQFIADPEALYEPRKPVELARRLAEL